MTIATFGQAQHLLGLADQLSMEQFQELVMTGLLTDLIKAAGRPGGVLHVRRSDFQKLLDILETPLPTFGNLFYLIQEMRLCQAVPVRTQKLANEIYDAIEHLMNNDPHLADSNTTIPGQWEHFRALYNELLDAGVIKKPYKKDEQRRPATVNDARTLCSFFGAGEGWSGEIRTVRDNLWSQLTSFLGTDPMAESVNPDGQLNHICAGHYCHLKKLMDQFNATRTR